MNNRPKNIQEFVVQKIVEYATESDKRVSIALEVSYKTLTFTKD